MYGKPSFYETKTAHAQTIITTIGRKELCSIGANQGPEKSYSFYPTPEFDVPIKICDKPGC